MLSVVAEILLALIFGLILVFITILGERNRLYAQRGWYIIVIAWVFLWTGSLVELADSFFPAFSTHFYQDILKLVIGRIGGSVFLLTGLLLN